MRAFLKSPGGCFQLKPRTVIGRHGGCDVVLQSAGAAERHAALEFSPSDGCCVLQDFGSLQGTFVNGCQVQNAAVGVPCPPGKRCSTWTGQLQEVAEPKPSAPASPPHLPKLQWQLFPGSPGTRAPGATSHLPRPPLPKPPGSAGVTPVPPATCSRTSAGRAGAPQCPAGVPTSASGGASGVETPPLGTNPALETHDMEFLPQKGEKLLQMEKEMERESKQKDAVVQALQEEVAAMAKTLAQVAARNEVELTQKLLSFNRELGAKQEEIRALRKQISHLQEGSSQIFSHPLYKKDLEIGRLQKESEELRRDQVVAAGLVSSLQREVASKGQKIQQLKQDVEKMKKETREKDDQLVMVSAKLESFKAQVMGACGPAAAGGAGKVVKEQEVIEKVKQVFEENQQSNEREKYLQEELSSRLSKEQEVSASVEVLEKSLRELQVFLSSSCSSTSLRGALGRLEAVSLDPSISAIRDVVVEVADVPLAWLEGLEKLLASAGRDPHASGKGMLASLGTLLEDNQETTQRNQMLQDQLQRVQESQEALLQEQMRELEAKHERDLRVKLQEIVLEKDKEHKEVLESTVAKEKDKCKQSLEEEQKKVQDLESHLRSMTEVVERKSKEQEAADWKLEEALHKLEEATRREITLEQKVLVGQEQLKTIQEQKELQRQELQEEIVGYKEQSKQHSLTIVALEDKLLEAKQQLKVLEEEKAELVEKMEGFGDDAIKSTSGTQLEDCPVTESHSCLREFQEELAAAQNMLLSKEAIIAAMTRELMETRARMSDMRGELSEEQKVELERSQRQVKCQEQELNLLRGKLAQMSSLVEKKDGALQAAAEELRQAQARCQALKDAAQERVEKPEDVPGMLVQEGEVSEREPELGLAKLGAKCRGLRHEETIQHQREGLAELRERVKVLEKRQCSAAVKKGSEPLVLLVKGLAEKTGQETGLGKEPAPVLGAELKAGKVSGHVPDGGSHWTGSSEVAGGLDPGEKMYLDILGALGRLMEVKELSGMQSLKQLPQEEREKVGLQRWKDLELLYEKIRNLKSRLERKEAMLEGHKARVEQLRLSQESLRRCQEEMSRLEDEAYREAEEKALLKEALERTQLQLRQEKRLLKAARMHKPGAKKPFCSGKLKTKECPAEAAKMGSM
ncbi:forkhead-associated domain-containing protein 1 isoform X3 [Apus apus]|uniref:forkhead-associated domain-containing protein 1 isoform X3 n=1 Tax=Apus apus TaxID=8895 RepID=UPI0021F88F74|nr:forkhead-associated domain-containing protein 1 isoform X3 [Apus apus]